MEIEFRSTDSGTLLKTVSTNADGRTDAPLLGGDALAVNLRPGDRLFMPEILYLGGTAARDISSRDLVEDVKARGRDAAFFATRDDAGAAMVQAARRGDTIAVMGARDDSLGDFARLLLHRLPSSR